MGADWIKGAALYLKERDPILAKAIDEIGECTLKTSNDYFGALARSIIFQQLSRHAASTIYKRFIDASGGALTPESVLSMEKRKFKESGISERKADYLIILAEKFASKEIDTELIENLSDEEIIEKLTAVKGIGRWSAQMVLIFSMNRPDVLPLGDAGFKRAVKINYNLDPSPSEEEIKKIAEAWRPYRSIASWYMWQTVNR